MMPVGMDVLECLRQRLGNACISCVVRQLVRLIARRADAAARWGGFPPAPGLSPVPLSAYLPRGKISTSGARNIFSAIRGAGCGFSFAGTGARGE
ncbi:hypothetical protein KC8_10000 [Sphingomonas sp. KC8]|nr:hypothetical protein KC8_10000 [Sphingomonas sp. KC8]